MKAPGGERPRRFGGVGTPLVAEFSPATFAARLGMSTHAARGLMADALDLAHRLPRLWERVQALEVRASYARLVAGKTRDLTTVQAGYVDERVVESADGRIPWSRFELLVEAAVKAADPEAAAVREEAERRRQFANPTASTEEGMRGFYIRGPFATIARLDAMVAFFAAALAHLGDTTSEDERRVKAVLILTNPVHALVAARGVSAARGGPLRGAWVEAAAHQSRPVGGGIPVAVRGQRTARTTPPSHGPRLQAGGPDGGGCRGGLKGLGRGGRRQSAPKRRPCGRRAAPVPPRDPTTAGAPASDRDPSPAQRKCPAQRKTTTGSRPSPAGKSSNPSPASTSGATPSAPTTSSATPAPAASARTRRLPDTLSGVTEGPPNPHIVTVVVTFNRLPLLQRLVARLAETEGLAEVLVVDNASTDGTGEWLASQPPPVRTLTLPDNRGGAGGFHAGLQQAVDDGADLVWLMDDDGIPEPDCLKILLGQEDLDFWGPAVLAEQDQSRLCFPIRLPGRATVVHRMAEVELAARDGVVADVVIPFNGVLVTRELVERIGTPREEFFIWGDDVEYLWRARRAGARTGTVVAARFLHPATDDLGTPMAFGRTTYNHSPSDLKHYCMARNNLVNLRDYRGWPAALAFVAKTAWFYTFTRPSPARLALSARAMYAGLRGDFTGHRRFLRG